MKSLKVQKTDEEIKLKEFRGELEAKSCFQIQSQIKYLRQTLVFMSN